MTIFRNAAKRIQSYRVLKEMIEILKLYYMVQFMSRKYTSSSVILTFVAVTA